MSLHSESQATPGAVFTFRWWYRGRTVEGNIVKFVGRIRAVDDRAALKQVEDQMRADYPTIRWMHGREMEGGNVTFGPTVQKLKTPVTTGA